MHCLMNDPYTLQIVLCEWRRQQTQHYHQTEKVHHLQSHLLNLTQMFEASR